MKEGKNVKRLLIVLLCLALIGGAAMAEDEYPSEESIMADMAAVDELKERATEAVEKCKDYFFGAVLDRVTVNPNYGTAAGGDFIGLIYMTYDIMDDYEDDREHIIHTSTTVATVVSHACPEFAELCVFWELPRYDAQAKVQFLIGDRLEYGDVLLPAMMVR